MNPKKQCSKHGRKGQVGRKLQRQLSTEVSMDISKSLFTRKISKNYNSLYYCAKRIRSKMERCKYGKIYR